MGHGQGYRPAAAAALTALPYPLVQPGAEARYDIDETLDLSAIVPMIAKPHSRSNSSPAADVAKARHGHDPLAP